MPTLWTRKEARDEMKNLGAEKYRVRDGHIDFYGVAPNTNSRIWYLAGYCGW